MRLHFQIESRSQALSGLRDSLSRSGEVGTINIEDSCSCDFIGPFHVMMKSDDLTRLHPIYGPQIVAHGTAKENKRLEVKLRPEAFPFRP